MRRESASRARGMHPPLLPGHEPEVSRVQRDAGHGTRVVHVVLLCTALPPPRLATTAHIFCDQGEQVPHLKWFGEKSISPGFPGYLSRVFVGREQDDR